MRTSRLRWLLKAAAANGEDPSRPPINLAFNPIFAKMKAIGKGARRSLGATAEVAPKAVDASQPLSQRSA